MRKLPISAISFIVLFPALYAKGLNSTQIFIIKSIPLISETTTRNTLDDLYQLDLDIKSGLVDRHYAFEMFLLKFKTQ